MIEYKSGLNNFANAAECVPNTIDKFDALSTPTKGVNVQQVLVHFLHVIISNNLYKHSASQHGGHSNVDRPIRK